MQKSWEYLRSSPDGLKIILEILDALLKIIKDIGDVAATIFETKDRLITFFSSSGKIGNW